MALQYPTDTQVETAAEEYGLTLEESYAYAAANGAVVTDGSTAQAWHQYVATTLYATAQNAFPTYSNPEQLILGFIVATGGPPGDTATLINWATQAGYYNAAAKSVQNYPAIGQGYPPNGAQETQPAPTGQTTTVYTAEPTGGVTSGSNTTSQPPAGLVGSVSSGIGGTLGSIGSSLSSDVQTVMGDVQQHLLLIAGLGGLLVAWHEGWLGRRRR